MGLDIAADRKEKETKVEIAVQKEQTSKQKMEKLNKRYENYALKAEQKKGVPTLGIVIKGIDISFWDLLIFLVKLALASIPAAIIVGIITSIVIALLTGLFGGMFGLG